MIISYNPSFFHEKTLLSHNPGIMTHCLYLLHHHDLKNSAFSEGVLFFMDFPSFPITSTLPYQQSLSPPDSTHQFLHRCMHSEPQRCFRLQPLRTYRRRFVHYYSASYLPLLRIRISLFEYYPNTGIILTFVPYDTRFLHYRQISFYRSRSHRQGYRQSLRHLLSVTNFP